MSVLGSESEVDVSMQNIRTRDDALQFLQTLEAPTPLVLHGEIVSEVAEQILKCLDLQTDRVNTSHVLIGAVLHDVGKIEHPHELSEPGHEHEAAGYQMLIAQDFPDPIAEMCIAHSEWRSANSLETLIVALADNLWKGKRVAELEDQIIRQVADLHHDDFWSLYSALQPCFDSIADSAPEHLRKNSPSK